MLIKKSQGEYRTISEQEAILAYEELLCEVQLKEEQLIAYGVFTNDVLGGLNIELAESRLSTRLDDIEREEFERKKKK